MADGDEQIDPSDQSLEGLQMQVLRKRVLEKRAAAAVPQHTQAPEPQETVSDYAEPIIRGAAQGASLRFADEIAGGLKTAPELYDYLKSKFGDNPQNFDNVIADYKKNRDEYRQNDAAARAKHPYLYMGGELGGGLATAAIPGLGALNVRKGATGLNFLAQSVGKGVLGGAIAGAGAANELGDVPDTAIKGGAVGGVVGAAVPLIGKGVEMVADKLRPTKLASTFLGAPEEAVERYAANPEGVMSAPTVEETVGNIKNNLKTLRDEVLSGSKASRQDLTEEGVQQFRGSEIGRFYLNKANEIAERAGGALTQKEASTVSWLEKQAEPFMTKSNAPRNFSPERVKDLIQEIDRITDAPYSAHAADFASPETLHLADIRQAMNQELRSRAPQYGETMDEVARKTGMLKDVGDLFRSDQGLANTLNRVRRDRAPFAEQQFQALDKEMGTSTVEDLRNALAREAFERGAQGPGGSRMVNLYSKMLEDSFGRIPLPGMKALGAATGAVVDRSGPAIGKDLIDSTMKVQELLSSLPGAKSLGKYAPILMDAAKRGNKSLAITNALLLNNDPEYRDMMNSK